MAEPKNKGGRPLIFKTAKELQDKIEEYFDWCDNRTREVYNEKLGTITVLNPAPYTMSGLARKLGIDRTTLVNYSKKDKFFNTIREAREKVHEDVETRLMDTKNEKGAIFNLKNNFGWKDKQELDHTTGGEKISGFNYIAPQDEDKTND